MLSRDPQDRQSSFSTICIQGLYWELCTCPPVVVDMTVKGWQREKAKGNGEW